MAAVADRRVLPWPWLRTELRTSPARWPFLVLTLGGGVYLSRVDEHWVGYWQDSVIATHQWGSIVGGISAAIIAALQAGRSRSRGVQSLERSGLRGAAAVVFRAVAPIWLYGVLAYLVMTVVAVARTAMVRPGPLPWGLVLLTIALLAFQVSVGALLGAWLPRWAAAVATLAVLYGGAFAPVFIDDGERTWGRLYPIVQQYWRDEAIEQFGRLAAAAVWLFAAAVVLTLLSGFRSPGVRPGFRGVTFAAAVAGVAAAMVVVPQVADGHEWVTRPEDARPVRCVGSTEHQVCGRTVSDADLSAIAVAFDRLHRAGGRLDFLPGRLVEVGGDVAPGEDGAPNDSWDASPDRVAAFSPDLAQPLTPGRAVELAVTASIPLLEPSCARSDGAASGSVGSEYDVGAVLTDRLTGTVSQPISAPDHAAVMRLPVADQDDWLNKAVAAAAACQRRPPVPTP